MSDRKLLILDIDNTLTCTSRKNIDRSCDFTVGEYLIYRRPYLERFLELTLAEFSVAIWSQSASEYVREIVKELFGSLDPLAFVWGGERCTFVTNPAMRQYYWVKDLRKVRRIGYRLERVIFIDDTARKLERSYGNLVRVAPFLGDPDDDELFHLMHYLDILNGEENVRLVEKRNWRERIAGRSVR